MSSPLSLSRSRRPCSLKTLILRMLSSIHKLATLRFGQFLQGGSRRGRQSRVRHPLTGLTSSSLISFLRMTSLRCIWALITVITLGLRNMKNQKHQSMIYYVKTCRNMILPSSCLRPAPMNYSSNRFNIFVYIRTLTAPIQWAGTKISKKYPNRLTLDPNVRRSAKFGRFFEP